MSLLPVKQPTWKRKSFFLPLGAMLLGGVVTAAYPQYPGHVDTQKKAAQRVRAVAVLEWTGTPGKPSASRMIPLSVFDGEEYQPGGLYLAKPEPLALESGTEYILEDAGLPKGLFDVNSAQDVQGYWFGYGSWRQLAAPPKEPKLQQAKIMPHVLTDTDNDRPHFKNNGQSPSSSGNSPTASTTPPASQNPPVADPDRPTLRRRPAGSTSNDAMTDPAAPETAIETSDPDRPHLTHGRQNPTDSDFEATKLTGTPQDLQQMVAVSDATNSEPHPFVYEWANPGDAAKMQSQLETLAQQAIVGSAPPVKPAPSTTHVAAHVAAGAAQHRRKPVSPRPAPLPALTEEHFKAFELTYSGGATLVFSAQTTDPAGKVKYVTLIAQPDFYGVPIVLFKSVTDDDHLDVTPRMRLVDAVDARANNRGDLVFELRGRHDRQFVIDRIINGQLQQVFSTGSLPLSQS